LPPLYSVVRTFNRATIMDSHGVYNVVDPSLDGMNFISEAPSQYSLPPIASLLSSSQSTPPPLSPMPPTVSQAPSEISMSPAATQEPLQSVQSVATPSQQSTQRRGKKRAGSGVPELTKKSLASWSDEATETLLHDVTHMCHTGYSAGSMANSAGWEILRATLKEKHGLDVMQQQIRYRLTKLKEEYNNYKLFCKATTGWGSRTHDGRPTISEEVMDTFFNQDIHERFRPFRHRRTMYEDLVFAYVTGSTATGDHARSPEE
ncbi:hypothetical protein KEM55_007641, partial [Ascosphaera atra]